MMTMTRARADSDESRGARPQLWCPGIAFVTPEGDVRLGRSAGYSSRDPSFRRLCCGRHSGLSYWTHAAWLVSRSALSAEIVSEHGIILPETLIDRDALPHAHRWLREQPLVCLSGATWSRLVRDGVPTFRVALDVTGDRLLRFERKGGPNGHTALTMSFDRLNDAAADTRGDVSQLDFDGNPSPVDRVLRFLSGGLVDESSVMNAFDVRSLIENGYGYRGALEGHFTSVRTVATELTMFDVLFGQIFDRAAEMVDVAERLRDTLTEARTAARAASVPLYGTAHAVPIAALRSSRVERLIIDGVPTHELALPAERRWTVDGVDIWSPHLPAHLTLVENASEAPGRDTPGV